MTIVFKNSHLIFIYDKFRESVTEINNELVLVCCLCISVKYLEDNSVTNYVFCKMYGINPSLFGKLERLILHTINYRLFLNTFQYFDMYNYYIPLVFRVHPQFNRQLSTHYQETLSLCYP